MTPPLFVLIVKHWFSRINFSSCESRSYHMMIINKILVLQFHVLKKTNPKILIHRSVGHADKSVIEIYT